MAAMTTAEFLGHEVVPPDVQAARDSDAVRILKGELNDPKYSAEDHAAVARELQRMGAKPQVPPPKATMSTAEFLGGVAPPPKADGGKNTLGKNLLAGVDMVLSTPAMGIGLGADFGMRVRSVLKGERHQLVSMHGEDAYNAVMGVMGNPIQHVLQFLGKGEDTSHTAFNTAMNWVGQHLDKGAEWIDKHTGGIVNKDDAKALTNAAMYFAGAKGGDVGVKALMRPREEAPPPAPVESPLAAPPEMPEAMRGVAGSVPREAPKTPVARPVPSDDYNPYQGVAGTTRRPRPEQLREAAADVAPRLVPPKQRGAIDLGGDGNKAFNQWFKGSKIVDQAGKPQVLYHGTHEEFDEFDPEMASDGDFGTGMYFTNSLKAAKTYGPNVKQVYLNMKNPATKAVIDRAIANEEIDSYFKPMEEYLAEKGYDGIAYDRGKGDMEYVVFDPAQIKTVTPTPKGEAGGIDPELLQKLGLLGAGAAAGYAVDQHDPVGGAFFGLAGAWLLSKGIGGLKPGPKAPLGYEPYAPDFNRLLEPRLVGRALDWTKMASTADTTILRQAIDAAREDGVTPEMDRRFRDYSEGSPVELSARERALYDKHVGPMRRLMAETLNRIRDPGEREALTEDINTRAAKMHRAWWEAIGTPAEGGRGLAPKPSAMKARTVYALGDGTIVTTKNLGGGKWQVTGWKDGEATPLGVSDGPLAVGKRFGAQFVKAAKQADIERHTPIRYVESDLGTMALKLSELLKYSRERQMVDGLLASPNAEGLFTKDAGRGAREGWVQTQGVRALQGVYMPREYAEVFDDFAKNAGRSGPLATMQGIKNIIVRSIMMNPIPHVMNETAHWFDARGLTGWLTPTGVPGGASAGIGGLMRTLPQALRSVLFQDKLQIELQKNGGALLYPQVRNARAWESMLQLGLQDALRSPGWTDLAKAFGTSPVRLAKYVSDRSSLIMWGLRDTMYTQLVMEQQLMGKGMQEAIAEVGKHMPEYRIPSRIITQGPAGRFASELLQSPAFIFSPYHYGMARALKEIAAEMTKKPTFVKGLDHAAAMLLGWYVLYPLLDKLWQKATGREDVKQRRAGPYHVFETARKVGTGETPPQSLMLNLLTPNPALVAFGEGAFNRQFFSGQPIVYPGTGPKTKALDIGKFAAGQFAPGQTATAMAEGRLKPQDEALAQMDVVANDPDKVRRMQRLRKYLEREGRAHQRRMEKEYDYEDSQ